MRSPRRSSIRRVRSSTTRQKTVCIFRKRFLYSYWLAGSIVSRRGAPMREKVVLAYSGGLDTSIIIPWLKDHYDCEVIAFVADVGQGDDIDAVIAKATQTGADKASVRDLRQDVLQEYV